MKWRDRGMPMDDLDTAQQWVVLNVIAPLREENLDTDLDEAIKRERLKILQIEADQKETERQKQLGTVLDTEYLTTRLTEDFKLIKDTFRSIPRKYYLELFEAESAPDLRDRLQEVIDKTLTDIVLSFTERNDGQEQ